MRKTLLLAFLLLGIASTTILAENKADPNWVKTVDAQLLSWQKEIKSWQKSAPDLDKLIQRQEDVLAVRQQADACTLEVEKALSELNKKQDTLGEPNNDETDSVKRFRKTLSKELKQLESNAALCRVSALAARELSANLKQLRDTLVSKTLGQRKPPIWESIQTIDSQTQWLKNKTDFQLWPAWLLGLICLIVLYPLASYVAHILKRRPVKTYLHMLAQRLAGIAILVSLSLFAYFGGSQLFSALSMAFALSLALAPLLHAALCQKKASCPNSTPARILLDLVLVGASLYSLGIEQTFTAQSITLLYAGYFSLLMLVCLWLIFTSINQQSPHSLRALRFPLAAGMMAGPIAYSLGYQALAYLLLTGIYGSLFGLLLAWLAYRTVSYLLQLLNSGTSPTGISLKGLLGYQAEETINGLWLVRLVTLLSIVAFLLYWLLWVWDIPKADINTIQSYFNEGFEVGATTIVPSKILFALLAFFILFVLARWIRKQLSEKWLQLTKLGSGAQQSIVSLTTYAIVGLAILLSLSMAGVELSNLALVAGALSVGIGFGLQNIVSNFISGLILLFERPVNPGDWVMVGGTEGYVKKISIRYTQIQTFDRADVLVPNSELISNQLTNWMLRDNKGRVVVSVGVAYGSDTQRVSEILNQIARKHPFVLTNDPHVAAPRVLFMAFGDSALLFELRCFIKDVDYKLSVRSDLLFEIDKAFREENIEIPFPQQDVHLHQNDKTQDGDSEKNQQKPV